MANVQAFGARCMGKRRDDGKARAIVCTLMDARKRAILLDSNRVYLKGTYFYVNEDLTIMQQKERKKKFEKQKKANDVTSKDAKEAKDATGA